MSVSVHASVTGERHSPVDAAHRVAAAIGAGAWRGRRVNPASPDLVHVLAPDSFDPHSIDATTRAEVIRVVAAADPGVADDCVRRAGVVGVDWIQIAVVTGAVAGGLHAAVRATPSTVSTSVLKRLGVASAAVAAAEATLSVATRAVDATRTSSDDAELLAQEATAAVLSAAVTAQAAQTAVAAALRDASDARLDLDVNARVAFWITAVSRQRLDRVDAERLGRAVVGAAF